VSEHSLADIPASRVVTGVRVGLLEGEGFVVNPTVQQMEASSLDLLLAGSSTAVLMIEGFAEFLPEEQLLEVKGNLICRRSPQMRLQDCIPLTYSSVKALLNMPSALVVAG
jgi:3' exoribonuclease family, domain 2